MLTHQPNANVNLVHPEVAAITRAQLKELPISYDTQSSPVQQWKKLKQEAVQVTKELSKRKPLLSELREVTVPETVGQNKNLKKRPQEDNQEVTQKSSMGQETH